MAEQGAILLFGQQAANEAHPVPEENPEKVESTDRGLFDFHKRKKEEEEHKKPQEDVMASEFEHKVQVSSEVPECKEEQKDKHESLLQKLHRSDSSSSSSSDEEGDDEEKKKRKKEKKEKKGLKEKLKEKLPGHHEDDTNVPVEKREDQKIHVEEVVYSEPSHPTPVAPPHQDDHEDKKGFLDKIKDKLPGHKKADEHDVVAPAPAPAPAPVAPAPVVAPAEPCPEGEKEKKGFLDKIKEKIPGFSSKTGEEEKKDEKKESD